MVACLLCCRLGPLIRFFVTGDSLVRWAPSDFDDDTRPGRAQRGDVLPRLEGILLPGAGFVRCHPSDGCLRVSEDCDPFRGRVSSRCLLQCVGEGSTLSVVGFLVAAHVAFDTRPD